jgi:hypothetical protein
MRSMQPTVLRVFARPLIVPPRADRERHLARLIAKPEPHGAAAHPVHHAHVDLAAMGGGGIGVRVEDFDRAGIEAVIARADSGRRRGRRARRLGGGRLGRCGGRIGRRRRRDSDGRNRPRRRDTGRGGHSFRRTDLLRVRRGRPFCRECLGQDCRAFGHAPGGGQHHDVGRALVLVVRAGGRVHRGRDAERQDAGNDVGNRTARPIVVDRLLVSRLHADDPDVAPGLAHQGAARRPLDGGDALAFFAIQAAFRPRRIGAHGDVLAPALPQ